EWHGSKLQQRQRRGGVPERPWRVVEGGQHPSQCVQATDGAGLGARVHDERGRGNDRVGQQDHQRTTEGAAEREQRQHSDATLRLRNDTSEARMKISCSKSASPRRLACIRTAERWLSYQSLICPVDASAPGGIGASGARASITTTKTAPLASGH